jgi:hypothetical protein
MPFYRDCVPRGDDVILRAVFTDGCGNPVAVDAGFPDVYLYDVAATPVDIDAEVLASFPNATATVESANVVNRAPGFYEITYSVPAGATAGTWTDIWHAEINGITTHSFFQFTVMERGSVATQSLKQNSLIAILLSPDIADINGNTLGEEIQLTFSTTYSPYYASPDLLRMECGGLLDGIPDDTLSLMIHWSSIEADAWSKGVSKTGGIFDTARTKFVIYDAALRALMLPADIGGKTKSLGDLYIQNDSSFENTIIELKRMREEWLRVVNAGGTIVPGQGLNPTFAVKGGSRKNRPEFGRMWHKPSVENFDMPTQNTKYTAGTDPRYRFGFKNRK